MEVRPAHLPLQNGFVLQDFFFPVAHGCGGCIQVQVRPRMIAKRESGLAPRIKHPDEIGFGLNLLRIHKPVGSRHVLRLDRADQCIDDLLPGLAWR